MENSMDVPQKTKSRTTLWSSNSTAGYISPKNENTNLKRYIHLSVHILGIFLQQSPTSWYQNLYEFTRIVIINYCRLGDLNNRNYFLTTLEARSLRSSVSSSVF